MIKKLATVLSAPAPLMDLSSVQSDKWQRLSPLSIIYFVIKNVVDTVKGGIQTFAIAPAAILATTGENRWLFFALFALGSSLALIIGSILSYINFKFRIEGNKFLIRSGVFKRKRLTLNFDRIQNIAFREPIYFRPFNLIILALESAGSSAEEVSLGGVPRILGQAIRKHVLEYKESDQHVAEEKINTSSNVDPEIKTTHAEEELLQHPISELVRYGISNNNIWVFAGLLAAFLSQIDDWWLMDIVVDTADNVSAAAGAGLLIIALFIVASIFLILAALMIASVLGAVIVNYNYRLTYADGRFHRTRGLLERQETSLPEVKIQNIIIAQPLIAKLLRRSHITVGQIGFKSKKDNNRSKKFIIPSVQTNFINSLTQRLYVDTTIHQTILSNISKKFIVRHTLFSVMPIALIVAGFWVYPLGWLAVIPLLAPAFAAPLITLRWKRYGYATDDHVGLVQSGFFGLQKTIFPFHKVQSVRMTRTPGQLRHGLATLEIMLAGKTVTIPYMAHEDATHWRDRILYVVETSKEPWM
ncbi:PH domain-containing protein [Kordiimonas aquimaris]|uniref:PH domain-containing protein n=1 Tax=Kordiimonas aquimaris TaxID=707591 RepID=UPI0021CECFD0|nr:PH domain-containing protein [Kordiimonas aquimaris]